MPEHRLKFSPQFKAEAVQMVVSNWPTYGLVLPKWLLGCRPSAT
jgi:hypothetical protein